MPARASSRPWPAAGRATAATATRPARPPSGTSTGPPSIRTAHRSPWPSSLTADTENHVIRRYLPREGKIVRVAGTGERGDRGVGGPPEQVQLSQPHGVFVHPSGALYIADSSNNRVLKIER